MHRAGRLWHAYVGLVRTLLSIHAHVLRKPPAALNHDRRVCPASLITVCEHEMKDGMTKTAVRVLASPESESLKSMLTCFR